MTDRRCAYIVTLAEDTRDDDAQEIVTALTMIRGVIDVTPVTADGRAQTAGARREWLRWHQALTELSHSMSVPGS